MHQYNIHTQCHIKTLSYSCIDRTVRISIKDGDKPDMGGTIRLAQVIDPDITAVEVFYDATNFMLYQKQEDGCWAALDLINDTCSPGWKISSVHQLTKPVIGAE